MNTETSHSPSPRRLLSIKQAAEVMGVGRSTLYVLIGAGKIKAVKLGKLARIQASEIDRYISSLPAAEIGGRADA